MMGISRNSKGFTIVELAVVIFIIGLIAAGTYIAYNGVQQRAREARFTAVMTQYVDIFKLYKANKGVFPTPAGSSGLACIGAPYEANAQYQNDSCYAAGDTSVASVDPAINADLKLIAGQLPSIVDAPGVTFYGLNIRGIIYAGGGENGALFVYREGNKKCTVGSGEYDAENNFTACAVTINE